MKLDENLFEDVRLRGSRKLTEDEVSIPKPFNKYFEVDNSGLDPNYDIMPGDKIEGYDCHLIGYLYPKKRYEDKIDMLPILTDDSDYPVVELVGRRLYPVDSVHIDESLKEEKIADKIRSKQDKKEMTRRAIKLLKSANAPYEDLEKEFKDTYGENVFDESLTEDVDDVVMIEVPDVIADIKEDELTPSGPAIGEDTGIADMLLDLINGENDTIKDYNIFKANLGSHPEFLSVIEDITNEENNHVGMLQTLLKQISPNVETIKQGEAEAEKDLIDDSQSFEVADFEVDDSFDNGFGGIYS